VPRIAVVVGNPKPASRTLNVATTVADVLAAELDLDPGHLVVDLAEHAADLFDWGAPRLTELTAQVASAGLIIAASPTYKATYTGMLKAFFDRYGNNGLAGSVAVPLMTGGAPIHLLAVEVHLRPLLVELGAAVPSRGLYVTEPEFADLATPVGRWSEAAAPLLRSALG
jgi:FMN reductase